MHVSRREGKVVNVCSLPITLLTVPCNAADVCRGGIEAGTPQAQALAQGRNLGLGIDD